MNTILSRIRIITHEALDRCIIAAVQPATVPRHGGAVLVPHRRGAKEFFADILCDRVDKCAPYLERVSGVSIVFRRLANMAGVSPHDIPKKVLVTGASGLIGGLIVTRLEDRYDFSALTRSAPGDWKCALHFC